MADYHSSCPHNIDCGMPVTILATAEQASMISYNVFLTPFPKGKEISTCMLKSRDPVFRARLKNLSLDIEAFMYISLHGVCVAIVVS